MGQVEADLPQALNGHAQPAQVGSPQTLANGLAEADVHPQRRGRRRIAAAGAATQLLTCTGPHDVAGALAHLRHLRHPGARVSGGDVATAQALDKVAHGLEQRLGFVLARIANDHGLATAQGQPGQGRFVGHAA